MAWDLNTIDVDFDAVWVLGENLGYLGRRDILGFPTECVADAVAEIKVSVLVATQDVACAEVLVAYCFQVRVECSPTRNKH